MTTDNTTAIAPYTQDGYRQLCERLDDDTVTALLHAHIRAFAADGSRALLKRLTEGLRIAGEMEKAGRNEHPDPAEQKRRARWDSNLAGLQQQARMAHCEIVNADNAAVSQLTQQCEKNGSCDTAIPLPRDDYGFAAALRDIPLTAPQINLLWRMAVLLAACYLNGTAGEHLGRALVEKTVYPVTVVSQFAWLLHGQHKSGQLQRDLRHTAAASGLAGTEAMQTAVPVSRQQDGRQSP